MFASRPKIRYIFQLTSLVLLISYLGAFFHPLLEIPPKDTCQTSPDGHKQKVNRYSKPHLHSHHHCSACTLSSNQILSINPFKIDRGINIRTQVFVLLDHLAQINDNFPCFTLRGPPATTS